MQIPDRLRAALQDERTRLLLALVVAFVWFGLTVSAEAGRNYGLTFIYGLPAVAVLLFWRSRPPLALGLSVLTLLLVLFGAISGTPVNGGGLLACGTAWFAVLGASMSADQRWRLVGGVLVALDAFLALANGGFADFLAVLLLGALAVGGGWAWRQTQHRAGLETALTDADQRSEAAEQDVLAELERNRLARDVHDVVAHSLAVVIAQADGARFAAETKPETVAPALDAIADTARRALGEVRTMLHDLRSSSEGVVPGADDLQALVSGVRGLGVDVEETVWGEPSELDRGTGLALYRIAQEALTNAMRHGDRSAPVGFELDWGERQVVLVVTNAVDAALPEATERVGQGVVGMRGRAADAGGDCTAGSGPNGRYRVRVALPTRPVEAPPAEGDGAHGASSALDSFLALFSVEPARPRAS